MSLEAEIPTASEALEDYIRAFTMRRVAVEEVSMQRQGKASFVITHAGHELVQILAEKELQPGDWRVGYYRSVSTRTQDIRYQFAQLLGDTGREPDGSLRDPYSGGRMMDGHFGTRLLDDRGNRIPSLLDHVHYKSTVSATASQFPPALGLARASVHFREQAHKGQTFPGLSRSGAEVVLVESGEGAMAEGNAYEAIAQAAIQPGAPMVISVHHNKWGISVPSDKQLPHASVSATLAGLAPRPGRSEGLHIMPPVRGWDYLAVRGAFQKAFRTTRDTGYPSLVECLELPQPFGHSSSGDPRRYKSPEELRDEERNDDIRRMREWLLASGHITDAELRNKEEEATAFVAGEAQAAWEAYQHPLRAEVKRFLGLLDAFQPSGEAGRSAVQSARQTLHHALHPELGLHVERDDTMRVLENALRQSREDGMAHGRQPLLDFHARMKAVLADTYETHVFAPDAQSPLRTVCVPPRYPAERETDSGAHIIASALGTLLAQHPEMVIFGEDTGRLGGVNTCTSGLQEGTESVEPKILEKSPALRRYVPPKGFGKERVWDHGIAEESIAGTAIGMALRGLRPVAELQYLDYLPFMLQQLVDELSCLRYRTRGGQDAPVFVRTHGHQLVGMWHSGSPMGMLLAACPELRVLVPRNGVQAAGMYRSVLKGRDPAFSVEPLVNLYAHEEVPENLDEITIPLGQSERLREGKDLTIITYGYNCTVALQAAELLQNTYGVSVSVVDLQTLNPLDENGVALEEIARTEKVLFLDEDVTSGAMAIVSKKLLLDRPGLWMVSHASCLTGPDHKPPYGSAGKFSSKPHAGAVADKVCSMLEINPF